MLASCHCDCVSYCGIGHCDSDSVSYCGLAHCDSDCDLLWVSDSCSMSYSELACCHYGYNSVSDCGLARCDSDIMSYCGLVHCHYECDRVIYCQCTMTVTVRVTTS